MTGAPMGAQQRAATCDSARARYFQAAAIALTHRWARDSFLISRRFAYGWRGRRRRSLAIAATFCLEFRHALGHAAAAHRLLEQS